MSEQHEASPAPAPAVAAQEGASQGDNAQHATPPSRGFEGHSGPAASAAPDEGSGAPAQPQVAQEGGSTPSDANAAPAAEQSAGEAGEDSDEQEGEEASAHEGGAAADPQRKKRRRRRRKKAGAGGAADAKAAPSGEGVPDAAVPQQERHDRPAREGAGGVFARFFEGAHAGKRHAFSVGEVVAGRVVRLNEGAFVVDLFGKATAFVDMFEPHEVPPIPEPASGAGTHESAAQSTPAAPGAAEPSGDAGAEVSAAVGAVVTARALESAPEASASAVEDASTPAGEPSVEAQVATSAPAPAADSPLQAEPSAASPGLAPTEGGAPATEGPTLASAVAPNASADAHVPDASGEHSSGDDAQHGEPGHEAETAVVHGEADHADEGAHEERAAEPEPAPPPAPELGTIFRGRIGAVAESGHVVLVNRIIDAAASKQRIVHAREQRQRVRGIVYGFNRGGFDVLVEGVRVFCPASGMALGPVDNPELVLGQRLEFTVPPAKAGTHGLVVSRRGILERQQRKAAKQLFRSLTPGQKLRGRVTQVREFGLFVDLGGIEGLVHQSELSFGRGVRPQDVAAVGDELEVQVLRVGEGQTRKERERVSLSLKALQADPWSAHTELLEPGNIVLGKVVRTTEFGAFIELAPQIEGLLHISELGRELKHASQALQEGEAVRVVVERVDRKARRISLSKLTQAEERSLEAGVEMKGARPPKPGQHLTVVVDKVEHAGLVVQVPGVFGRRGRGFIPNVEMGTERGTDHRRGFPPGTEIAAKVIGVDRDGGFRLSRKALLVEEEKRAVQDYRREAARHGLGTFGDLLRAKLEGTKQSS